MAFGALKPRTIICPVCKNHATEVFFGVGFPGWLRLMDVIDTENKEQPNPILCPNCYKLLLEWLNGNAKIILNQPKIKEKK